MHFIILSISLKSALHYLKSVNIIIYTYNLIIDDDVSSLLFFFVKCNVCVILVRLCFMFIFSININHS